jgi:flotillin
MYTLITIGVAILLLVVTFLAVMKRLKRCPSDQILVIYGKTSDGAAKTIHGGLSFVWPFIQDFAFLSLKPMQIDLDLKGALSKQNIRLDVPSIFTIAVSSEPAVMKNAAERLLSYNGQQEIKQLASEIIYGQMRLVIATMDIEEINTDRDKFLTNIQDNVESELAKVGLKLINVNISDLRDESGYINALGQEAAAKVINEAKVEVAKNDRDGEIGEKKARKEQRIAVSEAESQAQIGEQDAEKRNRIETSKFQAEAVAGENTAKIKVAESDAERSKKESEAKKVAQSAALINAAETKKAAYESEKEAEVARAEREKATQHANEIVPAEIAKDKAVIVASANAEAIRLEAQGDADALFAMKEAEAKGINEVLTKTAEGLEQIVASAGGDAAAAAQLLIVDKLPELYKIHTDAVNNIDIDKIVVWSGGDGGNGGKGGTAGLVGDILSSVPAYTEIFNMAGIELPSFLQGAQQKSNANANPQAPETEGLDEAEIVA